MTESLTDTVALVTGASSGIGAATAQTLAAGGATVALLARRTERLRALAEEIEAAGGAALVLEADITDPEQAKAAIERVVADLGRLDTVVNNAGVSFVGPIEDAPPQEWDQMIAVNVEGVLNVTRAALPHLVNAAQTAPRRVADLITISSTAGRVARPGQAVYALTKSAVNAFSEAMRQELQPKRVRVGVVAPGTVATELATHMRDGVREAVEQQLAGIELLRPQDIADAVAYMVTRKRHVAVNEILVRAAEQTW
ncbi:SDR family oxidoreductase [Micromonospora vulcania]|uniref:SDR family oxidoreductase n=1 Tax=Micromonospora vulcania TaxID=1441873 RepID=A0ABW1HGG0_9ACTN